MRVHDIQKFYNSYDEFLKTRNELIELQYKLKNIQEIANEHLNNTIDNKLEQLDLNSIATEYDMHKFNSSKVKALLDKIDELLFKDFDVSLKDSLEATELKLSVSDTPNLMYDSMSNYITDTNKMFFKLSIVFMHFATHKMFKVDIPVKQSAFTTVENWDNEKSGLYVVKAYANDGYNERIIGCMFDENKVSYVIKEYLLGKFDEEMKQSCELVFSTKQLFADNYEMHKWYDYNTTDRFVSPQWQCGPSVIKSCIDDRHSYKFK